MFNKLFVLIIFGILIFNVSCKKDPTSSDDPITLTDIDGNVYKTVVIGEQVWMAENLKVTHYRNGEVIPNVTGGSEWSNVSTGAHCSFDNGGININIYGLLYNWYAVNDNRKIAPEGWHIPTDDEWKHLEMHLGMSQTEADDIGYRGTDEGGKLKEVGITHWKSPNEGATNSSGFSAVPGGYRYGSSGAFSRMGSSASFWSTTENGSDDTWHRLLYYHVSGVDRSYGNNDEPGGFSVRCIRD